MPLSGAEQFPEARASGMQGSGPGVLAGRGNAEMGQAERARGTPVAPRVSEGERTSFYRAALLALRYVEHRRPTGRRFGPEADARWGAMRGHLATSTMTTQPERKRIRGSSRTRESAAQAPSAGHQRLSFPSESNAPLAAVLTGLWAVRIRAWPNGRRDSRTDPTGTRGAPDVEPPGWTRPA